MRLIVLYRPKSDHARPVETFVQEYKNRHHDGKVEVLDVDGREGSALASLYDIMRYPAILVLAIDGSVLQIWEGADLPLMDEVMAYTLTPA